MIVVSNTSPLTNLAAVGQFDLLRRLFGQINIPVGVWSELNAYGKRWPGSLEVENAIWIKQHTVQDQPLITALTRDLDQGEAESIALAIELQADLVLLDEKEARHAAQRLGLIVMGVVGVLLLAHARKDIDQLKPYLDALRQRAGFYLSESLYQTILEQVKEGPQ
jgi:predicted nucleic acid-binding protein